MSQYGAINKSLQSQDNSLSHHPFNDPPAKRYSSIGLPFPENAGGGMLKKSIRFEYEFSSPRMQPLDESQPRVSSFISP